MELKELFTGNKSLLGICTDIEFLFLLKSWKVLSDRNELDSHVTFEAIYNQTIDLQEMHNVFKQLSKSVNAFSMFMAFHKDTPLNYDIEEVIKYLNIVANDDLSFSVIDAFEELNSKSKTYIPQQLVELGYKLVNNNSNEIYMPFSHTFSIFSITDKKVYFEDAYDMRLVTSDKTPFILELIKIIENKDIEFPKPKIVLDILNSPFDHPTFVNPKAPHLLKEFESVLSFPTQGLRAKYDITEKDRYNRFKIHKGTNLDVAHFEHILAQTKEKAVVLMPVGFTYRGSTEEEFRKYLVEKNYLEAIIQLPPNLHSATSIETVFFVINKYKNDNKVQFINLKDDSFIVRDGRKLVLKNIDDILDIYENKKELENISVLVTNDDITNNNYSLAIDRYVIPEETKELQKIISNYKTIELQDIAEIRKSQLFRDEGNGKEVYELSPSDFEKAGFTKEGGKLKKIGSQFKKYDTYKLQAFDILVSTKGTIGKVAIIGEVTEPLLASQASQVIRVKDKDRAIELYMFFKSDIGQALLRQLVAGTAMPQIATSEIRQLHIPILSKNEKERVLLNFNNEIELYNKIDKINTDIKQIHSNFLGAK
ncbi:MAG: N-6 DNA methylase [Sulfurimonas sp.]